MPSTPLSWYSAQNRPESRAELEAEVLIERKVPWPVHSSEAPRLGGAGVAWRDSVQCNQ